MNCKTNSKVCNLLLTNNESQTIAFKFKTNIPEKFHVKPVAGKIESGKSVNVVVHKNSNEQSTKSEQFLLQSIVLSQQEATDYAHDNWKTFDTNRITRNYLPCRNPQGTSSLQSSSSSSSLNYSTPSSASSSSINSKNQDPQAASLATLQLEQTALKTKLQALERQLARDQKPKSILSVKFDKHQLIFLSICFLLVGLIAPWLSSTLFP